MPKKEKKSKAIDWAKVERLRVEIEAELKKLEKLGAEFHQQVLKIADQAKTVKVKNFIKKQ